MTKRIDGDTTIMHVRRRSLPWREATLTECGLPADQHPSLSPADHAARVRRYGEQRTALMTCQTCWYTSQRYDSAQRSWLGPEVLTALDREIEWARRHRDAQLHADLMAIEVLINRHRAEFDELIEDQRQTVRLPVDKAGRPA